VIKLERPGKGEAVRAWGDGSERHPYFRYINRNKKGITLDYKEPEGRALFLRPVEGMDVLVENYRPTVMRRAGLGYEALREVNPATDLRPASFAEKRASNFDTISV
jgi:CoA:oxalate CoA-transferase